MNFRIISQQILESSLGDNFINIPYNENPEIISIIEIKFSLKKDVSTDPNDMTFNTIQHCLTDTISSISKIAGEMWDFCFPIMIYRPSDKDKDVEMLVKFFAIKKQERKTKEIPFDTWTQIPNKELANKGLCEWVYRPSNYTGPLAIDGFIRKETLDAPGSMITMTREEAEIIWPKK